MVNHSFADRLCRAEREKKSVLCGGLDPQIRYMPLHLIRRAVEMYGRTYKAVGWLFAEFNFKMIDAFSDIVACVKPNIAFYLEYGSEGLTAYERTLEYARNKDLIVIGDAKPGDGGDTADAYADGYIGKVPFFGPIDDVMNLSRCNSTVHADCVTVNGYIGEDCIGRFVKVSKEHGTGIFVVGKTSFKPRSEIEMLVTIDDKFVWEEMAEMVGHLGEGTEGACGLRNVGVVMGATYPSEAIKMREILPNAIFLIPGFGGQGAGADDAVVGIRKDGLGGIVNNSRNLIYAWQNKKGNHQCEPENFAHAARLQAIDDRDALNEALKRAGKYPF